MNYRFGILIAFVFLAYCSCSNGKKSMWGTRKKKEDTNNRASREHIIKERFVMDVEPKTRLGRAKRSKTDPYDELLVDEILATIQDLDIDTVVDSISAALRDFVASDEFDNLVTPDSIQQIISQLPQEFKEISAFQDVFASEYFTNPVSLKLQLLDGINMIGMKVRELRDTMNDRGSIAEFLGGVPHEFKQLLSTLLTGGDILGNLSRLVNTLPGLSGEQRALILSIISSSENSDTTTGSTTAPVAANLMTEMLQQVDDALIEQIRSEYISNPEVAEVLLAGLDLDPALLLDQEQFAAWFRSSIADAAVMVGSQWTVGSLLPDDSNNYDGDDEKKEREKEYHSRHRSSMAL